MISVPGIGSGLDINAIVDGLVAAEGDAKTLLLANKRANIESEISAFGSLKSIVSAFQSSSSKLADVTTYTATTATTSDATFFTASAAASVAAGNYDIEIRALAESQKLLSAGYADADTNVGTGTLTIEVGTDSFDVVIDSDNQTLSGIRDAINSAEDNSGVTATLLNVDDGAGGTLTKLVLTSDDTGSANAISVTVDDDDLADTDASGLSVFYYDTDDITTPEQMSQINAAVDAELYIDGQKVLSSTNTVSSAIDGVTLVLNKAETGTTNQLSIQSDTDSVKSAIELFVSNYNSFISFSNSLSAFNADSGEVGILLGDSTLRTLSNAVRVNMSNSVSGLSGELANLVDLGITTGASGALEIDSTKLQTALDNNGADVVALFSSTDGVATRLNSLLNEYVKSEGILDNKTSGLNETIDDIDSDLEKLSLSLQSLEERLFAQFSALDLLVNELNSTGNFLTQQFEQISRINQPNNN